MSNVFVQIPNIRWPNLGWRKYQCPSDSITSEDMDKQAWKTAFKSTDFLREPKETQIHKPQDPNTVEGNFIWTLQSMLEMTENLLQEDQSSKAQRPSKSSLPKVHRGPVNIPNSKGEKRQKAPKTINTIGDSAERCSSNISQVLRNPHTEQMLKYVYVISFLYALIQLKIHMFAKV